MQDIIDFARAVVKHWVALMTGSVFIALITLWQWFSETKIPVLLFVFFVFAGVVVPFFRAWKDTNDQLKPFKARDAKATVLRQLVEAATAQWGVGAARTTAEGSEAWIADYAEWLTAAKARVSAELDDNESVAIFLIGNAMEVKLGPGVTLEHQRRMGYLAHHMIQLQEALKRYLPR